MAFGFPRHFNLFATLEIVTPTLNQLSHVKSLTSLAHNTSHTEASNFYSSLIQQCTRTESLRGLGIVQTHMIKSGYMQLSIANRLVDGCLKCGSLSNARKVFDELPERHVVIWNAMISSYIGHKKSKEAIGLYGKMVFDGVLPDEYTFSSVFKAFSGLGLVYEARRAHGLSVVLGLEVANVFVGSALVDMYAKFGRMGDARLVSNRVGEKDVVLFTALIVGYSQHGDDGEALEVFGDMINQGVKANEYTFASILITCGNLEDLTHGKLVHGLVVKSGCEAAVASQTSLLTMYARCGLIDDSLRIFKRFHHPNLVTWTSLIVALVRNGREELALIKFRKMIRDSVVPNSFTLSSVLQACSSLAMMDEGQQIHAMVTKFGLDRHIFAGAALINLYGKCGNTEMARSVFDALIEIDLVSVNSMIYSYAQNGFGHEALQLFDGMKDLRLEPNDVTILSVLLACNNSGLVQQGCQIFSTIRSNHNIELTRDHYACMVDLLGRAGRLEDAEMLIKEVKNPDLVLWRALLSACKLHGQVEMAERALKKVLELAPGDGGSHVLLTNLYASNGNWSQVIDMKSTMREMKFQKNPAMSWVDVDREVHTFMAGDLSHSRSREINETLEKLFEEVQILGYVPDTRFVLQDLDEEKKKRSLYYHSEKLAIAFALLMSSKKNTIIRIFKNLKVCGDCHSWIKFVTRVIGRDIIARDAKRFHHFKDGCCSCRDYW
ncbi:putative tetratricopeptide-like helical domain, DYW domain-containing protein [Rosa chinensis]|uniref:Putative tetratricopeptide-like helical domain, DYW domain-containing protein n=1 Tax=Rosa chinensis TaxID=74649 RepID=A0A2P6RPS4_ROSCH|nr:pentatricopeptide repeat-containing protein At5g65570 [Rosa chinensis]PRQ48435.1 putative tetratricopeptide-like helical domain, DYW domain-containing protein [Rosa chinensis]